MPTESEPVVIHCGDCLEVLRELPDGCVDAVITDPPYSSGGMVRGDRTRATQDKYKAPRGGRDDISPDFTGDTRDQRGYAFWSCLWLGECQRILKSGGIAIIFTDWRQLPTVTDVIQAAGLIWRGIVPWSKPGLRPMSGRFRAECEYVVWGSNGPMPWDWEAPALPGFFQSMPPRERDHLTQKPIDVMRELVKICPLGGMVLDPFAGSGTTAVAAQAEGRRAFLIEKEPAYVEICRRRIDEAMGMGKGSLLKSLPADLLSNVG